MSKIFLFSLIYILGVIVSSFAQILLKKSALIKRGSKIKEYINIKTIIAYSMLFSATFCSMFAYKYIPLSMGPILGTTEYIFIAILSYLFLKEKINKRKFWGLTIIILGIIIYSL